MGDNCRHVDAWGIHVGYMRYIGKIKYIGYVGRYVYIDVYWIYGIPLIYRGDGVCMGRDEDIW